MIGCIHDQSARGQERLGLKAAIRGLFGISSSFSQQMHAVYGLGPGFIQLRKLRFITACLACTLYGFAQSDERNLRKRREEIAR